MSAVDFADPRLSLGQVRALQVLQRLGYTCLGPEALAAERDSSREVILVDRLVAALRRLNPGLSEANLHRALRELTGTPATDLAATSQRTYALLTQGLVVDQNGRSRRPRTVRYLDFGWPAANDLVVTWQLPVRGVKRQVVLDLVVFVNGIPLVLMMCEPTGAAADPAWPQATLAELYRWQEPDRATADLGVPRLFETVHLVLALGAETAVQGSVLTPPHRFAVWPTSGPFTPERLSDVLGRWPTAQDRLLYGMLNPPTLIDLLRDGVAFCPNPATGRCERTLIRDAESVAVASAVFGAIHGDGGVIWHALGSDGHRQRLLMAWTVKKLRQNYLSEDLPVILVAEDSAEPLTQALQEAGGAGLDAETFLVSAPRLRTLLTESSQPLSHLREKLGEGAGGANGRGDLLGAVVLIAEALGKQADGLVDLIRQTLPAASILSFTSTPLATQDINTALGSYLATYRFADARAEGAAVPVYFEARPPDPGRAAERRLVICRDLHAHFLRVIRPGGGRAQLLVRSQDEARLYKQTLDRLGGIPSAIHDAPDRGPPRRAAEPEIFIACHPVATDEALANMQAVYLDTALSGRALLKAVLSVNTPTPQKLFSLVIDYAGTPSGLPSLPGFTAADIADALLLPANELRQLPNWHRAVLTLLSGAKNLYSLEQCMTELADPANRGVFQSAFRQYARSVELLLDSSQAAGFLAELRWLGQVLLATAARYRDDRLSLVDCGARIQKLIAEAIVNDGNQRLIERTELLPAPVGFSPTAAAVYAVLTGVEALAAAESEHRYGPPLDPLCYALARQLDELIAAHSGGAELGSAAKADLLHALTAHLVAAGFAESRAQVLTNRIFARLALRPA